MLDSRQHYSENSPVLIPGLRRYNLQESSLECCVFSSKRGDVKMKCAVPGT